MKDKVQSHNPTIGKAWKRAEQYGFDMSLIEANLRRTPWERIRQHDRALATALALKQAMRNAND
jgi:hypothetical protein